MLILPAWERRATIYWSPATCRLLSIRRPLHSVACDQEIRAPLRRCSSMESFLVKAGTTSRGLDLCFLQQRARTRRSGTRYGPRPPCSTRIISHCEDEHCPKKSYKKTHGRGEWCKRHAALESRRGGRYAVTVGKLGRPAPNRALASSSKMSRVVLSEVGEGASRAKKGMRWSPCSQSPRTRRQRSGGGRCC
jgi:hypothetical protein